MKSRTKSQIKNQTKIPIGKNNGSVELKNNNITQEMSKSVNEFFQAFLGDYNTFDEVLVFNLIFDYISNDHRILYSPISSIIYAYFDENEPGKAMGMVETMVLNIEKVIAYTESKVFTERLLLPMGEKEKQNLKDTKKAIVKIWDHVNLAQQQYSVLKQTDDEYKKKFDRSISTFKEELTKDMNAQLLTMIGMFTALAFLIFGGISSLAGIFSSEFPLLKLIVIGSVWGICIVNMIFVFLFCVGKMTKLSFASLADNDISIFQRYPIVWWSNYIMLSILALSVWGYYINKNGMSAWISNIGVKTPEIFTIFGTIVIIAILFRSFFMLINATKYEESTKIRKQIPEYDFKIHNRKSDVVRGNMLFGDLCDTYIGDDDDV
jgi:hypothetical protein